MPAVDMQPAARRLQWGLLALFIVVEAAVAVGGAAAVAGAAGGAAATPASAWRSRTVYQVLTDRFATDQCWGPHGDPDSYNGGTFSGLRKKMHYIEEMGFDAVWISPVTEQGDDHLGMSGYAGYWPANFYKINPAFGTEAQLVELVQLYHQRGMLVLFDLVINHVGYGNWQTFYPFNKTSDFHDCNGCFTLNCAQDPDGLFASPPISEHSYEHCQLSGLPDLNHSDPTVLQRMRDWELWLVKTFKPDGLRYDAATNSLPSFVQHLSEAVPQWTISEIYLEEPLDKSSAYIADWVHDGRSDSAFGFTMQTALRRAIRERKRDMRWLLRERERWLRLTGDKVHDFGMFIENHDMARWLAEGYDDYSRYMNGIVYILFTEGIPFIYYGAEQGFLEEREPLWYSLFQHSNPLWLFLRISVAYRKQAAVWDAGVAETVHVDNSTLVLARGDFVIVLTNVGQDGPARRGFLTLRELPPRFDGSTLRNIYNRTDKLEVSSNGIGMLLPDAAGKPQVFYKGTVADPQSFYVASRLVKREMTIVFVLFLALLAPALLLALLLIHCWALQRRPRVGEGAHTKGTECDASYTPHDANGFLYNGGGKEDGGKSSGSGRLGHLSLLSHCLRKPTGRSKPPVANQSVLDNSDLMPRTRSMTHSRLREMSAAQVLAAPAGSTLQGRLESSVHSGGAASSVSTGGERFDAFTGFSSVFKEPGRVSAVDLSQGLVLEEYYVLQEEYDDVDGLQQDVSAGSGGELRRRKGDSQGRMESKLSTVLSGQVAEPSHVRTVSPRSHSGSSTGAGVPGARPRSIIMANHSGTRVALPISPRPPLATPKGLPSTAVPFEAGHPVNGVAVEDLIKAEGSRSTTATATSPRKPPSRVQSHASSKSGGIHWPWKDRLSKPHSANSDDPSVRFFDASKVPILHVALEYSIPHLGFTNQLMFGGLGMVVTSFIQEWPGPMSVIAPLYKACYGTIPDKDAAAAAAAVDGGGAGPDGMLRPTFIPSSQLPLLEMTVDVAGQQLPVEVFKVETSAHGHARTYYLVQSELFRHRLRGQIYTFEDEDEMLTWLAVFNQATAAVIVQEGITHMQLHDYHGGLSLMYVPERLRPAVLYVAHNAHYDATFPIPTPARRNKVYEHLGLNAEQASPYVEHNGSLDMLRAVVMYLRRQQQGWGVVAVSPRYAQQIKEKLSVFWQLQPLGRPRNIIGILNCLDMSDSLAASDMALEQVLVVKAEAKRKLQETYCLAVGEQYTVLVFIGRITHQKGCDIIAEAAPYMMAHHPQLQLIMVGPTGDAIGSAASAKLAQLSLQYPDRLYCPQDYYVAGDEKNMLLVATDFSLVPSRFEPCGLVDIEFGWNGGLVIGHNTGGLGKMPGVYFNAQASHLAHLARKLEAAVDTAMMLSQEQRHAMIADALSKRFPADVMMEQYSDAWANINQQYVETLRARRRQLEFLHDHADFFANKWARVNKKAAAQAPAPAPTTGGAISAAASAAVAGGAAAGPLGGVVVVPGVRYAAAEMFHDLREPPKAAPQLPPWLQNFPAAQRLSNYLLVVLQYWGLGPGAMLLSYLLLQEALVTFWDLCGLQVKIIDSLKIASAIFGTAASHDFVPRLLMFFFLSTLAAPFWFYLAARLRPVVYIRLATVVIFLSFLFVFISMYFTELLGLAIITAGVCNLVANPTLSMGFLGDDEVEVSEVGRRMLTVSETTKFVLLAIGMLLAGVAHTAVPHLVVTGILTLLSGALMAWFCHPMSLSKAYEHLALTFAGQWELLKHLSCFWLSLVAATCDSLGLMLTGFLVITTTRNLDLFASFMAIAFGASAAAVLWNYKFLCSRTAELRLNTSVLGLATMPLYEMLKATVLVVMWSRGLFAPGVSVPGAYATVLAVCGVLDLLMGGRSSVLGLAGFVTLPSREVVAIWQFIAIIAGSASALLIIGMARVATMAGAATSSWLLFGLISGLELVRLCSMAMMAGAYPRENLSAP